MYKGVGLAFVSALWLGRHTAVPISLGDEKKKKRVRAQQGMGGGQRLCGGLITLLEAEAALQAAGTLVEVGVGKGDTRTRHRECVSQRDVWKSIQFEK